MKAAYRLNSIFGWVNTKLRTEIVTIRNTSCIAVVLVGAVLCTRPAWSQTPEFQDAIAGSVTCSDSPISSFQATGSAANDYILDETTEPITCSDGSSGSADAQAKIGTNLSADSHFTSALGPLQATPIVQSSAASQDTVNLIPPDGFTGQSVTIKISEGYAMTIHGTNSVAAVCWQWTGMSRPRCPTLLKGRRLGSASSRIIVKKTTQGFSFFVTLGCAVAGSGGDSASALMGTPTFMLPLGWTYKWASGQ